MLVAEEEGAEQGVNFPQVIMLKKAWFQDIHMCTLVPWISTRLLSKKFINFLTPQSRILVFQTSSLELLNKKLEKSKLHLQITF